MDANKGNILVIGFPWSSSQVTVPKLCRCATDILGWQLSNSGF